MGKFWNEGTCEKASSKKFIEDKFCLSYVIICVQDFMCDIHSWGTFVRFVIASYIVKVVARSVLSQGKEL